MPTPASGGTSGACTIGFNAQIEGNNVFVTASHCSHAFTSLDSDTAFHSGVAWAPIAREWRDPPAFNCPFPWSGLCRLSDAAAFRYDISADSIDFGIIAQPYLETIQINPADSIFEVVGKWSANPPPQYSTLYHIGIDQGFQGGFLMSTCSAGKFKYEQGGPERTILCVNKYATDSDTGDSGGPVFTIESDDEVALTGIHTGRTQCCFGVPILVDHWYTDFAAIEADLGSMWVWEPFGGDPLTAEIDGPSDVPPYYTEGCEWWANVSGGTGSYTYEWKWDGQVVGTDYFYAYEGATEGQHWLEVSVGDGTASAWDGMIVDTDYSHSCLPF